MTALLFGVFGALLLLNAPVSFSLGLAALVTTVVDGRTPLLVLPQKIFTSSTPSRCWPCRSSSWRARFLETGGVGRRLVNLANVLVRHLPGGLGLVVIVATIFFSEVSGSSAADAAAIGSVTIPAMIRLGYPAPFATAIVAVAGGMAVLIPPSITGVIYGWLANASVAAIFAAGFLPCFVDGCGARCSTRGSTPAGTSSRPSRGRPRARSGRAVREALPALIMPVIILGGIFGGIFTATESAAVAVLYGLAVALVYYRELGWRDLPRLLTESAVTTGIVSLLLGLAGLFAWVLTVHRIPATLASLILALSPEPLGVPPAREHPVPDRRLLPERDRPPGDPGADPPADGGAVRDRRRPLRDHPAGEPRHRLRHAAGGDLPLRRVLHLPRAPLARAAAALAVPGRDGPDAGRW